MHRILGLLLLLFGISCQKWKPTIEQVADLCGPEWQGAPIIRFQEPDGDRLYTDESYDFSVYFQTGAGAWHELLVNSYGCITPPQESGTLVARSVSRSWAAARTLDRKALVPYEELPLKEAHTSAWEFVCPAGGWIAEDRLSDLLHFSGTHSEVFDVQIKARSDGKPFQLLYQKKIGLGLTDSVQDLNLLKLDVGVHELNLFVGFAGPETPDSPLGHCPLEIVRHEPTLTREPWRDGEILALHEKRGFFPTVPGDRLMICRSPGYAQGPGESCEIGITCQDPRNFVEAEAFSMDNPGPWTYVYYLENRAGRRGPMHCRRVFGSEKAPDFDLRWQDPRWNKAGQILSSLPAQIEATFESRGHSREPLRPEPQFMCKVDFVHQANVISGEGVRCLSGLCAGQSLVDFVPCSSPLRFTADKAFDSELLLNSELRLTVRADDGAGQISSQTRSLMLQHAQNFIWSTSKSLANLGENDVNGFWYKPGGGLFLRTLADGKARFFELARFSGGAKFENWKEAPSFLPADQILHENKVSITDQGTVMASWYSRNKNDQTLRNDFALLDKGSWTTVTPKGWDAINKRCTFFHAESDQTFLCFNNFSSHNTELLRLSLNKEPEVLPLPELPSHCKTSLAAAPITWFINARRELFAICRKEVAFRLIPGGTWESFPLPGDLSLRVNTVIFDEEDQPWFVMRNGKDAAIVAPTRLTEAIPLPPNLEAPASTTGDNETFGFDAQRQLRVGPYIWSSKDRVWVIDQNLLDSLGTPAIQVRTIQGEPGALFFETSRLSMLRSAQGQDRLFPLHSLQWPQPNYDQFADPVATGVKLGPQGELCWTERLSTAHVRCILRKNWAQRGDPATQLAGLPSVKKFIAGDTGALLAVAAEGIYQAEGSTWNYMLPPAPDSVTDIFSEGDSFWASDKDKIYRLKRSEKVWHLVSETHETQGQLSRLPARRSFTDTLGQVWISNRIQTSNKIGTRTLVKFSGDVRSLISLPEDWKPLEFFPLGTEIIFLNEVSEAGQTRLKIHAMDVRTHKIRECDPGLWGFDLGVFTGRNMENLDSWAHDEAIMIFDIRDRSLMPIILDFKQKRQIRIHNFPFGSISESLAGLFFMRLGEADYLFTVQEKSPRGAIVDNYSVRKVTSHGEQQLLFDTDDLRSMEDRPRLRVTMVAPLFIQGPGSKVWIRPTEKQPSVKGPDLFQFDWEALGEGQIWKSR